MKIGEFSRKYNVSVATTRHYINTGLLVPEKNGFQYNFTKHDCDEMEAILSMKNSGFKLSEMNKYLSILRFYNKDDYLLYKKLLSFLAAKKNSLHDERDQINTYIRLINKKIKEIEGQRRQMTDKISRQRINELFDDLPGFPLEAVSLLRCPDCRKSLRLFNVDISGDSIINGSLTCSCGYSASVKNGVMYTDNLKDLENDPAFLSCYFGDENLITNEDGMFLMAMDEYTSEYLTLIHKDSLWIRKELKSMDLRGRNVLFPDIASQYLYSHYNGENIDDSICLVTALSEKTIHNMRKHIANANPDLKVAYIINQDGRLPLMSGCIDAVIDYLGSDNLAFFHQKHYYDTVAPYISPSAFILGAFEYYKRPCLSLDNIHQIYTNACPNVFTPALVSGMLSKNGFYMEKSEKIGEGYDPGLFFEYHVPGDIRVNTVFLAKRSK